MIEAKRIPRLICRKKRGENSSYYITESGDVYSVFSSCIKPLKTQKKPTYQPFVILLADVPNGKTSFTIAYLLYATYVDKHIPRELLRGYKGPINLDDIKKYIEEVQASLDNKAPVAKEQAISSDIQKMVDELVEKKVRAMLGGE